MIFSQLMQSTSKHFVVLTIADCSVVSSIRIGESVGLFTRARRRRYEGGAAYWEREKEKTKRKTYGASGPCRSARSSATKMGVGRWNERTYVETYRSWNWIHFIHDY
jgi:hypothetical protein